MTEETEMKDIVTEDCEPTLCDFIKTTTLAARAGVIAISGLNALANGELPLNFKTFRCGCSTGNWRWIRALVLVCRGHKAQ